MATATTLARPAHATTLRNRRDPPRPNLAKRPSGMDAAEPIAKKRKLNEPYVRTAQHVLQKFRGRPPSLIIHLHQTYFRFDDQEGSFALDSPMRFVLQHLRHQTVPHEMMEELLANNVPFYDGCLIVEVHNHRSANGKDKSKRDSAQNGGAVKFSMHNFDGFITPSPLVPYPKNAKIDEAAEAVDKAGSSTDAVDEKANDGQGKEGPKIATIVLQPTPLSRHHEMLILARTPASDAKAKRKSADSGTPLTGQPPTPQLAVPSSTLGMSNRSSTGQNQKMCLEEQDFYQFEADLLVATEAPLYLEPVNNPRDAQKVLDMLAHPLHSQPPPSPKTRKRTTAEMAADDAQAAEAERRMLIMDERIKPSVRAGAGAASSENQGAAASLVHSRFKTIQMVREKHEEQERIKKEEEDARAALERRQQEEAAAAAQHVQQQTAREQQARILQASKQQRELMVAARARQQQQQADAQTQLRAQQLAAAQAQAQAQQMAAVQQNAQLGQNHAHQQQNGMMQNQAQANFQHGASMSQTSPVVRQQTPMMNSSPMMPQNGFPMTANSSQGAGSPPRPPSAAMTNANMAMARQASQQQQQQQQQHPSRNNTPQIPQGTPSMSAQAMPNRQMSQTPRMPHGSPAPGTPASGSMASIPMQTPNQAHMRPEQMAMLATQQHNNLQNHQAGNMHAGSAGQPNLMAPMTPEQIQNIRQQQQQQMARSQAMLQAQAASNQMANPQMQALMQQQMRQRYVLQQQQQQRMMLQQQQQQQQQQNANAGQAGSPGIGAQTPQMNHALPQQNGVGGGGDMNGAQQMTPQQRQIRQAQLQAHAQATLQALGQQYGGVGNIPQEVIQTMSPQIQMVLQRHRQAQAIRAQQMAMRGQQAQNAGQMVVGNSGGGNDEYMQMLRNQKAALAAQQQMQGMQGMQGMNMNMNMNGMQGFGGGQIGGQGNDLQKKFADMQNALQRQQAGGGGGGMQ